MAKDSTSSAAHRLPSTDACRSEQPKKLKQKVPTCRNCGQPGHKHNMCTVMPRKRRSNIQKCNVEKKIPLLIRF
jgi:hypothetical protein